MNGGIRGTAYRPCPAAPDHPPYEAYAALIATYAGLLATAGVLGRLLRRSASTHTALDFAVLAAANFKAARTISHDKVTSFVREPFVEGEAYDGEDETPAPDGHAPRRRRARHVLALHRHVDGRRA